MEQIDLNQIKLEDTGIFEKTGITFYSTFKKYNITTVGQVLDDSLMYEIMQVCKMRTRMELKGFIALLKYKYLGIFLPNNEILEQNARKSENDDTYYYPGDVYSFGLCKQYTRELWNETAKLKKEQIENKQLVDFLKEIYNERKLWGNNSYTEILRLHIESYEKSKQLTQPTSIKEAQPEDKTPLQQEYDILVILKDQLVKLVGVRDSLDAQIEDLQQKIDALTNSKTEGGVSK